MQDEAGESIRTRNPDAAEGATHPQSLRLKNRFVAGDSGETGPIVS